MSFVTPHRRRGRAILGALLVVAMVLPVPVLNDRVAATGSGGPVLLDGGDPGFHGFANEFGDIYQGWDYMARWYEILRGAVSATYNHNGRVAVIGTTANSSRMWGDCGSAVHEISRVAGAPVDTFRGSQIASLLEGVASGVLRYQLIHIVEQTDLPGAAAQCSNGLTQVEASTLHSYAGAIALHVNRGGALFANNHDYRWLTRLEPAIRVISCSNHSNFATPEGIAAFPQAADPMVHQVPYHACIDAGAVGSLSEMIGYRNEDINDSVGIGGRRITLPVVGLPAPSAPAAPDPAAPAVGGGGSAPSSGVGCLPACGTRLWGEDRFGTAAALARDNWGAQGSATAVVALGTNFPDAIVGGPLAARLGVPTLLVRGQTVPHDTLDTLRDLNVGTVYLVGGPAVVGEAVATQLRNRGLVVERLYGADRYATSAQVSSTWASLPSRRLYVADGNSFIDQLVAASLAASDTSPMLLWGAGDRGASFISAEARRLSVTEVVAVGAAASAAQLQSVLPNSARVTTITADNPAALSVAGMGALRTQPSGVMLVTERDFADALAATPVAAGRSMHLLLTPANCVMPAVAQVLNSSWASKIVVVGGSHAVAPAALEAAGVCP